MVRDEGFEPPLAASETVVLPLDESRIRFLAHSLGIEPTFIVSETIVLPLDDLAIFLPMPFDVGNDPKLHQKRTFLN